LVKNLAKNRSFLHTPKNTASLCKNDHSIGFREKKTFFRRK
jgi:hypothetical protein